MKEEIQDASLAEDVKLDTEPPVEAPQSNAAQAEPCCSHATWCNRFRCGAICSKIQGFLGSVGCRRFYSNCGAALSLLKEQACRLGQFLFQKIKHSKGLEAYQLGVYRKKIMVALVVLGLTFLSLGAWMGVNWYQHSGKIHLDKALYLTMNRPLVVRFDEKGMFSLIRVKLTFLTRDEAVIQKLSALEMELKENFVESLAQNQSDPLLTRRGKEELLARLLEEANRLVHQDKTVVATKMVESVLLEEFVMQ